MAVEVDALTEALCFVSEQLSRVLRGDTGTRMEGLRCVSQTLTGIRTPVSPDTRSAFRITESRDSEI